MATIVNAADVLLQATSPRVLQVTLPANIVVPSDNVTGLPALYNSAKEVALSASSLIFQVPKVGAISPTSILLTAVLKNIVGTPTFTVTNGTVTLNVSGNTATFTPDTMTTNTVTIQVSVTANSTTYTDEVTVVKLIDGSDAVVGLLSNESVTVAADAAGNVSSSDLTAAGGTFFVFQGLTNETGTSGVTYSVMSQTGMSVSIASTGVYTISSVTANTASATLRAVFNGVTVDKVLSISKSIAGQNGTNGSNGVRGTVNIGYAVTGSTWTDANAVTAISNAGYGVPQARDIVTEYNTSNGFSVSKYYDGSLWQSLDAYVNGNMLVTGTVTSDKMSVTSLSAISANIGTVTSGTLKTVHVMSGAYTAFAWPAAGAGNTGFYLGPEGLLLGNANNGKYFEVTAAGDISAPQFSITSGSASFSGSLSAASGTFAGSLTAQVIQTDNIVSDAMTEADFFTSGVVNGTAFSLSRASKVLIVGNWGASYGGNLSQGYFDFGVTGQATSRQMVDINITGGTISCSYSLAAGNYTISLTVGDGTSASISRCLVLKVKK